MIIHEPGLHYICAGFASYFAIKYAKILYIYLLIYIIFILRLELAAVFDIYIYIHIYIYRNFEHTLSMPFYMNFLNTFVSGENCTIQF